MDFIVICQEELSDYAIIRNIINKNAIEHCDLEEERNEVISRPSLTQAAECLQE